MKFVKLSVGDIANIPGVLGKAYKPGRIVIITRYRKPWAGVCSLDSIRVLQLLAEIPPSAIALLGSRYPKESDTAIRNALLLIQNWMEGIKIETDFSKTVDWNEIAPQDGR